MAKLNGAPVAVKTESAGDRLVLRFPARLEMGEGDRLALRFTQ